MLVFWQARSFLPFDKYQVILLSAVPSMPAQDRPNLLRIDMPDDVCQRKSELGRFGETVVCERLGQNGYSSCAYLGGTNRCFDIEANKNGQKFLISVKTRNHTTDKNDLKKDGYNLFYNKTEAGDPDAKVRMALEIAHGHNAIPMWVTVTVDATQQKILHVCYGLVADLPNKKLIPMSPSDILRHRKLGEQNVFDPRINPMWSNVKRKREFGIVKSAFDHPDRTSA